MKGRFTLGDKAARGHLGRMKLALGRVASILITASGLLLAGARGVLDLIGYSTAPEDVEVAQTRLSQLFDWFLSVPWWAVLGFALICTIWLIWVSWPRQTTTRQETSATVQSVSPGPPKTLTAQLEFVWGEDFTNKTVVVDGKHFEKCTFGSTVFHYNGGPFLIKENCMMKEGECLILTKNTAVMGTIGLMMNLRMTKDDVIKPTHLLSEKNLSKI